MNSRPPHIVSGRSATLSTASASKSDPYTWDRIYPLLPPHLQARLLSEHFHLEELPDPRKLPTGFVQRWLACDVESMPPLSLPALPESIIPTNPAESHVLGLWAGQPELLLVDAEAGPTQWRLARQAVEWNLLANQRVAIITSSPTEADELVQQLAEHHPELLIGRAVAPMEDLSRLPQCSTGRTASVHGQGVLLTARKKVQQTVEQLQAKRAALRTALEGLSTLPDTEAELAALRLQRQALETTPVSVDLEQVHTQHRCELAALDAQIAQHREELVAAGARLAKLEHDLAQVKAQQGGLFGKLKSILGGSNSVNIAPMEKELKQLQDTVATILVSVRLLEDGRTNLLQRHAHELAELQARHNDETARQHQQLAELDHRLEQQQTILEQRRIQIQHHFQQACGNSSEPTAEAIQQALANTEAEFQFCLDWQRQLQEARPELMTALLSLPQVVIGPLAALATDPLLQGTRRFDAVIVLGADLRDEQELNTVAQRGERQLWLGDLKAAIRSATLAKPYLNGNGKAHAATGGLGRGVCFRELWRRLNRDFWKQTDTGWVAQLMHPLPSSHDDWLAEPLADRPEIELRFWRSPRGELQLAEMAFPEGMSLADAKAVLSSELGECLLQPLGAVAWTSSHDWIEARWTAFPDDAESRQWLELPDGIQEECYERLTTAGTSAIRFRRAQGWTEDQAQVWLAERWRLGPAVSVPQSLPLVRSLPIEQSRLAVAGVRA